MVSSLRSSKTSHKNSSCIHPECATGKNNIFKIFQLSPEAEAPLPQFSAAVPAIYIPEYFSSLGHLF